MAQKPKASFVAFDPRARAAASPTALPLPLPNRSDEPPSSDKTAIDLAGKRKAVFLIGRGRIGKTTLARWIAETVASRGGEAIVAAADPVNRSLRTFLDGVAEPPSADPAEVKDWLRSLLEFCLTERQNSLIDLGGGDTALSSLLQDMPNLADVLSDGGVEPVALYVIGPDPHDASPMALTEAAGFQPKAAAIIANEAHGRRAQYDRVLAQPEVRAVLDRGGIQLWMPALAADVARQFDANAWRYFQASEKAGPFAAAAINGWLRRMAVELGPIASWLPE